MVYYSSMIDVEQLLKHCDVEHIQGSGAGGQHRNRTFSGVRITHLPTGLVARATERRSQADNLRVAIERLIEKIAERNRVQKKRVRTKPTRSSKEKRIESKKRHSSKKANRRDF